jgi:hypothetical protein
MERIKGTVVSLDTRRSVVPHSYLIHVCFKEAQE